MTLSAALLVSILGVVHDWRLEAQISFEGEPVGDVRVVCVTPIGVSPVQVTDHRGSATFRVPPTQPARVLVLGAGRSGSTWVDPADSPARTANVVLDPRRTLRWFRTIDRNSMPVVGAEWESVATGVRKATDALGLVSFEEQPADWWTVSAEGSGVQVVAEGELPPSSTGVEVVMLPREVPLRLHFDKSIPREVLITLLREDVTLPWPSRWKWVDRDTLGFVIRRLPEGVSVEVSLQLVLHSETTYRFRRTLRGADAAVEVVRIPDPFRVSIQVAGPNFAAGDRIGIEPVSAATPADSAFGVLGEFAKYTDALDGSGEVSVILYPGEYWVGPLSGQELCPIGQRVSLSPDQPNVQVSFDSVQLGFVRGRVVNSAGEPSVGAEVGLSYLESSRIWGSFRTFTDLDGEFRLGPVPQGAALIGTPGGGHPPCDRGVIQVEVAPGDTNVVLGGYQ